MRARHTSTRVTGRVLLALAFVLTMIAIGFGSSASDAGGPRVVILDTTVSGGAASPEAQAASDLGFAVDIVDGATWSGMSTADFAAYDGIILGDPTCTGPGAFQPAIDNAGTWGAAVGSNALVVGTDPVFHLGQGGDKLTSQGVAFALADPSTTGAYVTLSCFGGGPEGDQLLSGLGGFTVEEPQISCNDDIRIVAEHPAFVGLTDADLADWGCSVHEVFTTWPGDFEALAVSIDTIGPIWPDGSQGTPYIMARGVDAIRAITLTPETATNEVGQEHTLTAEFILQDVVQPDAEISFEVLSGPNTGVIGTAITDANGIATIAYTSSATGTDIIIATHDTGQAILESNEVEKIWVEATAPVAPAAPAAAAVAQQPTFTG